MERQPAELRALLDDRAAVERVAGRLDGRPVLLIGTGTSWHTANECALLLARAVEAALAGEREPVAPPSRQLDFAGSGINQWVALEGALKAREAARIPAAGFETEYLLHGRVASIATAAERTGAAVHRIEAAGLAQPLGVFPLTASVQRIALELAEQLGVNPDSFGFDDPQRWAAFEEIWPEL
jgi:glucosamine 6-phosphate synthetase-like amidotransferase/phosphosugar isomerase protein